VASASKKLLKELPTKEQMTEIIFDLKSHGDAATAMMGCAYPEHALESLFKAHFRPLNSEDTTRMSTERLAASSGRSQLKYD
jgi:hypothetical protein